MGSMQHVVVLGVPEQQQPPAVPAQHHLQPTVHPPGSSLLYAAPVPQAPPQHTAYVCSAAHLEPPGGQFLPLTHPELQVLGPMSAPGGLMPLELATHPHPVMTAPLAPVAAQPALLLHGSVLLPPGPQPMLHQHHQLQQVAQQLPPWQPQQPQPQPQPQRQTTVFFAGVNPTAPQAELLSLFAQFGCVLQLDLFKQSPGSRTSKGCGLVVFSSQQEAAAAMDALHGRFVWPGARSAMVIEWMDPGKQHKKRRAQPLTHSLPHGHQQPRALGAVRSPTAPLAAGTTGQGRGASITAQTPGPGHIMGLAWHSNMLS